MEEYKKWGHNTYTKKTEYPMTGLKNEEKLGIKNEEIKKVINSNIGSISISDG